MRCFSAALCFFSLACPADEVPSDTGAAPDLPGDMPARVNIDSEEPADGEALYLEYCALCHGDNGEGYVADNANALANGAFLAVASDEFLAEGVRRGRPGTSMSAWGEAKGGPLSPLEVDALVAFMRGWQTDESVDVSSVTVDGVADRAEPHYELRCQACHGEKGAGGEFMSIANPEFLATASDGFLRYAIQHGRIGTPMPEYGTVVTAQTLDDLVVLIRSWQTDTTTDPVVLPPKELPDPVLNKGGPEPDLGADPDFVSAQVVMAALDAKAQLVIVDARPPSDYVNEHIAGAVSVPFYDVADFVAQLPKEVATVTYCGCPHAESGIVAKALKAAGHGTVKVLDEGFFFWKEQGYPTHLDSPNP